MGMWSVPWKSVPKAEAFAKKMNEPWMAFVRQEDDDYFVEVSDIKGMFWEQDCLVGCDYLLDMLNDHASEHRNDFDIREMVKESLKSPLENMEIQLTLPTELQAVNIVRKAVGKKELNEEFFNSPAQNIGRDILNVVKSHKIGAFRYQVSFHPAPRDPIVNEIQGFPDDLEGIDCYSLVISMKEEKEVDIDFSSLEVVKKITWRRPGLLNICYILT